MSNDFVKISDLPTAETVADTDLFIIETLTGTKAVTRETLKADTETVTKEDVGLGNVDNTSDLDKPISTATQSALNAKLDPRVVILPMAVRSRAQPSIGLTQTTAWTPRSVSTPTCSTIPIPMQQTRTTWLA